MEENYPKHIGIILDGNRRWAKEKGRFAWDGHKAGFDKLSDLFKWARELKIKELSLYCFSTKNFQRDPKEVSFLMRIFEKAAKDVLTDKSVHENRVKIRFIGRLHMLPDSVQKAAKEAMEATKEYDNYIVNFCVAYGGREEIVDAANRALQDAAAGRISSVDEKTFNNYMYIQSDPDFIIRTSGEFRTSDFLTWHASYSEWIFLNKYWPDFSKQDLEDSVKEFLEGRQRRFGK